MNRKRFISCILLLSTIGLLQANAQENINSTGGKATGTNGNVSYSVGQMFCSTSSSEKGTISEGVQHPYEIFITTGIELSTINLELKVFPNPTANILTLKFDKEKKGFSYQMFSIDGKILKSNKINSKTTQIEMLNLEPSTYFLRVTKQDQIIKSFKIIKN